jgi:hypothetical protein
MPSAYYSPQATSRFLVSLLEFTRPTERISVFDCRVLGYRPASGARLAAEEAKIARKWIGSLDSDVPEIKAWDLSQERIYSFSLAEEFSASVHQGR